jgi:hypothetical protein
MPDENRIVPTQVTKPIQLLAAWLVGLIAIDTAFLTGAAALKLPTWASGLLVIAAIVNVPLFLFCLFLLQTKFRPEMQEDSFYSKHLDRTYSEQSGKVITLQTGDVNPQKIATNANRVLARHARVSKFLSVNDLLPNYDSVTENLKKVGLRASDTFGSTSVEPVPPSKFVISVGTRTPHLLAQNVIEALKDDGLDGVGVGWEMADCDRIYVGAYSYDDGAEFVPTDSEDFRSLLNPDLDEKQFFSILMRSVDPI